MTTTQISQSTTSNAVQFEVGKTYYGRSVCDYNCIFSFVVIARTEKTVTMICPMRGEIRRGVSLYNGVEQCKPHGSYSMALILCADKVSK